MQDLLHCHHPHPHRRQFERERQTVEATADRRDHILIVLGDSEAQDRRRRAFGEQVHRLVVTESLSWRRPLVRFRHRQRRNPKRGFSPNAERFPAGRENPKFRAGAEKGSREFGHRFDEVLAVVQYKQQFPCREVLDE